MNKLILHPVTKSPPLPPHPHLFFEPLLPQSGSAPSVTHSPNTTVGTTRPQMACCDGAIQIPSSSTEMLSFFSSVNECSSSRLVRRAGFQSPESCLVSDKAEGTLRGFVITQPLQRSQMAITDAPGTECKVSHKATALDFPRVLFTIFLFST